MGNAALAPRLGGRDEQGALLRSRFLAKRGRRKAVHPTQRHLRRYARGFAPALRVQGPLASRGKNMSLESVRRFFAEKAPDIAIIEAPVSTATVELAARAHGVAPGQIAKTLSLRVGEQVVLVVMRGDARLDNAKLKQAFGVKKAKMLDPESVQAVTGHPVGGVCPFGLATDIPVYCDQSLRDFEEVLPAAGDIHTAVRISPERLATLTGAQWVDVAKAAGAASAQQLAQSQA